MSLRPIRFHGAARTELSQAVDHYDEQVSGLGDAFAAEVEHSIRQIATYPNIGTPHLLGTRRVLLEGFPFSIIYEAQEQQIVIVAIAHQRRMPGYWLRRL